MKKMILIVLVLALLGGWGLACKSGSSPTSSNGTPVPGGGGY